MKFPPLPPPLLKFRATPEFVTDGCSGYISWLWSDVLGRAPLVRECCEAHDHAYWAGEGSRLTADLKIAACIGAHKPTILFFVLAIIFFVGIRLGGVSWLPFSWRWGYRYDFFRTRHP